MSDEPSDRALLEQMELELLGESPPRDKPSTDEPTEETRRKRTRGRRSRNRRQRRRRESSDSSKSFYSPSSRSSENSEEDNEIEDDEEDNATYLRRRTKEAREAPLRSVHEPTSPLEEPRVPRRIEFACSIREAPEIAGLEKKKLRARVKISDKLTEHFDSCAAGLYVGSDERAQHYEKLPLVASGLAVVPVLDKGLRVSSFGWQSCDGANMGEMEVKILDIEHVDDRTRALDVINNMWVYRDVESLNFEGCSLEDSDLDRIQFSADSVKYVCFRRNLFRNPWKLLAAKFPNLLHLDLRENSHLKLDDVVAANARGQGVEATLPRLQYIYLDPSLLCSRHGSAIYDIYPSISHVNDERVVNDLADEAWTPSVDEERCVESVPAELFTDGDQNPFFLPFSF